MKCVCPSMGIHPAAAHAIEAYNAVHWQHEEIMGDHPIYDDHHQVHEEMVFECMMRMDKMD